MRSKSLLGGAVAIAAFAGVAACSSSSGTASPAATKSGSAAALPTAATSSGATKITCTFKIYSQTPTKLSGFAFGYVNCPQPFGNGVQSSTYSATVNAATGAATNKGAYKNWFDAGTTQGTFSLSGQFTSPAAATFEGTFTVTGGTGAFKATKGTGTLTCSTTNADATSTCTSVLQGTGR